MAQLIALYWVYSISTKVLIVSRGLFAVLLWGEGLCVYYMYLYTSDRSCRSL